MLYEVITGNLLQVAAVLVQEADGAGGGEGGSRIDYPAVQLVGLRRRGCYAAHQGLDVPVADGLLLVRQDLELREGLLYALGAESYNFV